MGERVGKCFLDFIKKTFTYPYNSVIYNNVISWLRAIIANQWSDN